MNAIAAAEVLTAAGAVAEDAVTAARNFEVYRGPIGLQDLRDLAAELEISL